MKRTRYHLCQSGELYHSMCSLPHTLIPSSGVPSVRPSSPPVPKASRRLDDVFPGGPDVNDPAHSIVPRYRDHRPYIPEQISLDFIKDSHTTGSWRHRRRGRYAYTQGKAARGAWRHIGQDAIRSPVLFRCRTAVTSGKNRNAEYDVRVRGCRPFSGDGRLPVR